MIEVATDMLVEAVVVLVPWLLLAPGVGVLLLRLNTRWHERLPSSEVPRELQALPSDAAAPDGTLERLDCRSRPTQRSTAALSSGA